MNDPMEMFDIGEDLVIEIVEMAGMVDGDSFEEIDSAEAQGIGSPMSAMDPGLDGKSDGVGARGPAPKGNCAGPSVRP